MERQRNCFSCGKSGHYSNKCPHNSSAFNNKKRKNPSILSSSTSTILLTQNFPSTYCRCGGGLCIIKLNPRKNKPFYCCPNKYEMHCGYFRWCDTLKQNEILEHRPPPYPCCSCGAGICSLETEKQGPFIKRKYFACRIPKGQGACNFRQWLDDYNQLTSGMFEDTTAYDIRTANEINMIRREIENGMDPDYPYSHVEALVDETSSAENITHCSPLPSPNSPLDVGALGSMDTRGLVVTRWWN